MVFNASNKPKRHWEEVAQEAQAYRDASIARLDLDLSSIPTPLPRNVLSIPAQVLSADDIEITKLKTEELLALLANGLLGAETVVTAFLHRAAVAQKVVREEAFFGPATRSQSDQSIDKLHNRATPRACSGQSSLPG